MASLWGQVIPPNAPAPIYPVPTEYHLEWQQMYFMFGRYQPEHVLGYRITIQQARGPLCISRIGAFCLES